MAFISRDLQGRWRRGERREGRKEERGEGREGRGEKEEVKVREGGHPTLRGQEDPRSGYIWHLPT